MPANRRKRLWELDGRYHCAVIGTCLTLTELHKIGRRARIRDARRLSDYELHTVFVGGADRPTPHLRLVNKALDAKFRRAVRRFATAETQADLALLWEEAAAEGEVTGAFWALLTHPVATEALRERVHGEVHMLSHLTGATTRADMRWLHELEERCAHQEQELVAAKAIAGRRLEERDALIRGLRAQVEESGSLRTRLRTSERQLAALESGAKLHTLQVEVAALQGRLASATRTAERGEERVAVLGQQLQQRDAEIARLRGELEIHGTELKSLEEEVQVLLQGECSDECEGHDGSRCTRFDLCRRRILYVGGRVHLTAHCRALVERHNGEFLHHDGGVEERGGRLDEVVSGADAIVCPLDCVSHDAVRRIRRLCQRYAKQCILLRSTGLSSFARALRDVAA